MYIYCTLYDCYKIQSVVLYLEHLIKNTYNCEICNFPLLNQIINFSQAATVQCLKFTLKNDTKFNRPQNILIQNEAMVPYIRKSKVH